ncbi:hypothetical protein, partial [Streptomyces thermoviolaceus]|uniref:hypothetical protein n=2 Tax=Streptomyces thermoviolaceus TaxID=1952 RepID=UPI001E2B6307
PSSSTPAKYPAAADPSQTPTNPRNPCDVARLVPANPPAVHPASGRSTLSRSADVSAYGATAAFALVGVDCIIASFFSSVVFTIWMMFRTSCDARFHRCCLPPHSSDFPSAER